MCFKLRNHSTRFPMAEFTSLEVSMWINKLNLNFKDAFIPLGLSCISFFHQIKVDEPLLHAATEWRLEWRLKVFPSSILILFCISLYQGMPSCSLFLKLRCCMLPHMNEIDLFIFHCVFLYEIQNYIFPCVFPTIGIRAFFNLKFV